MKLKQFTVAAIAAAILAGDGVAAYRHGRQKRRQRGDAELYVPVTLAERADSLNRPDQALRLLDERRDSELSSHILPTSATMVGVCVTVLSIAKLAAPGTLGYVIDKFLAIGSLAFLASAMLSFVSIRSRMQGRRLEAMAEWVFLGGLALLSAVTLVVAFAIA